MEILLKGIAHLKIQNGLLDCVYTVVWIAKLCWIVLKKEPNEVDWKEQWEYALLVYQ